MTTTITPALQHEYDEHSKRPSLVPDLAEPPTHTPDKPLLDPTQGRTIGSDPYDDPTQGRQIGSDPYDDPTQGRKIGAEPHGDPTQGRKIGARETTRVLSSLKHDPRAPEASSIFAGR